MKTQEKWKPKNKSKGLSDVSQTLDQHRNNLPGPQELENSTQGQNARVNSENDNLSGHYSQRHDDIVCDSHLEIETTKKHGEETNREKNMEYILQPCVSREKIKQAKYLWDLRWSRWWGYNWRRKRNEIVRRKRVIINLDKPAGIINKPSLHDVNIFDDASIDQETGPFYDGESGCSGNDSSSHTQKTSSSRHDSKFRFKSLRRILHILSAQRTSFVYVKQMITLKNIKLLTKKFRTWVGKLSTKHDAHGDCPQPLYSLIQFPSDEVELKAVTFSKEVYSHGDEVFMPPFGSDGSRVGLCKKHPYFCSCANTPEYGPWVQVKPLKSHFDIFLGEEQSPKILFDKKIEKKPSSKSSLEYLALRLQCLRNIDCYTKEINNITKFPFEPIEKKHFIYKKAEKLGYENMFGDYILDINSPFRVTQVYHSSVSKIVSKEKSKHSPVATELPSSSKKFLNNRKSNQRKSLHQYKPNSESQNTLDQSSTSYCMDYLGSKFGKAPSPVQKDHSAASNRFPRYRPQLYCSTYDARKTLCSHKPPPFITVPVTPNSPRPLHTLNTPSLCGACSKAHRTISNSSELSLVTTGYSSSQLLSLSTQLNALNRKYSLIKNTLTNERNYKNVPYSSLSIPMPYQYPSYDVIQNKKSSRSYYTPHILPSYTTAYKKEFLAIPGKIYKPPYNFSSLPHKPCGYKTCSSLSQKTHSARTLFGDPNTSNSDPDYHAMFQLPEYWRKPRSLYHDKINSQAQTNIPYEDSSYFPLGIRNVSTQTQKSTGPVTKLDFDFETEHKKTPLLKKIPIFFSNMTTEENREEAPFIKKKLQCVCFQPYSKKERQEEPAIHFHSKKGKHPEEIEELTKEMCSKDYFTTEKPPKEIPPAKEMKKHVCSLSYSTCEPQEEEPTQSYSIAENNPKETLILEELSKEMYATYLTKEKDSENIIYLEELPKNMNATYLTRENASEKILILEKMPKELYSVAYLTTEKPPEQIVLIEELPKEMSRVSYFIVEKPSEETSPTREMAKHFCSLLYSTSGHQEEISSQPHSKTEITKEMSSEGNLTAVEQFKDQLATEELPKGINNRSNFVTGKHSEETSSINEMATNFCSLTYSTSDHQKETPGIYSSQRDFITKFCDTDNLGVLKNIMYGEDSNNEHKTCLNRNIETPFPARLHKTNFINEVIYCLKKPDLMEKSSFGQTAKSKKCVFSKEIYTMPCEESSPGVYVHQSSSVYPATLPLPDTQKEFINDVTQMVDMCECYDPNCLLSIVPSNTNSFTNSSQKNIETQTSILPIIYSETSTDHPIRSFESPVKLSEPALLYNVVSDKTLFPPNISQQDEIVISSAMYESESSPSIEPVQWYLEDPLPDVESLLVAVPDPHFYVSPPDTAPSPPTIIIPMERAMQPGKKVTIVAPESKVNNYRVKKVPLRDKQLTKQPSPFTLLCLPVANKPLRSFRWHKARQVDSEEILSTPKKLVIKKVDQTKKSHSNNKSTRMK